MCLHWSVLLSLLKTLLLHQLHDILWGLKLSCMMSDCLQGELGEGKSDIEVAGISGAGCRPGSLAGSSRTCESQSNLQEVIEGALAGSS